MSSALKTQSQKRFNRPRAQSPIHLGKAAFFKRDHTFQLVSSEPVNFSKRAPSRLPPLAPRKNIDKKTIDDNLQKAENNKQVK